MSASERDRIGNAVRPIATANATVSGVVQDLARRAKEEPNEETRRFLLEAANRLLAATTDINASLRQVSQESGTGRR